MPVAALALAREHGSRLPLPGNGATALRWSVLAAVAAANLTVARVLEAHTDALAILAEAGAGAPDLTTMGVFAAESPGQRLEAAPGVAGGRSPASSPGAPWRRSWTPRW